MSQEEVEIRNEVVRRHYLAFESDTEAFRATLHPEIEWYPMEENHSPYHGVEAAMRYRNRWLETWDEHSLNLEEVIEEGDSAVALLHVVARGRGSGVEVDIRAYVRIKVRDGKVVYIYDHEDRHAALEAAGLRE